MTKKCDYCGKSFTPHNKRQRFCSDACRKRSFRESQQEDRKKAVKAYREKDEVRPRHNWKGISSDDPRWKLARLKAKGICSFEYWDAFQECDRLYYGCSSVVNGVSTMDPLFSENVMYSIEELGIVRIEKLGGKQSNEQKSEV